MALNGRPYLPGYTGGGFFIGILGAAPAEWEDGPKYRGTNTPVSSKKVCFDAEEPDGVYAPGMIPSPLGRGLPSRHGYGKSL